MSADLRQTLRYVIEQEMEDADIEGLERDLRQIFENLAPNESHARLNQRRNEHWDGIKQRVTERMALLGYDNVWDLI